MLAYIFSLIPSLILGIVLGTFCYFSITIQVKRKTKIYEENWKLSCEMLNDKSAALNNSYKINRLLMIENSELRVINSFTIEEIKVKIAELEGLADTIEEGEEQDA